MKTMQRFAFGTVVAALLVGLVSGCQKSGPAETAGQQIDKAVEKTGQQMEKAADAVQEAVQTDKK